MPDGQANIGSLRLAIAEALWHVSANELEDVCIALGLAPSDGDDPMSSKRIYVRRRLHGKTLAELAGIGRRVIDEYGDPDGDVVRALGSMGTQGVDGELKNLIFASTGPKPRIVLRDAINNVIDVVENAEHCLVYDRPLGPDGLTWGDLSDWWADAQGLDADAPATRAALYERLRASVSKQSPPEQAMFRAYRHYYRRDLGGAMPVLLPQVYLHYDPYTLAELATGPGQTLLRQRMDFLLLLPNRARVVIEVDGKQHYADGDRADPARYAEMVREDRALRLAGYEIYRFGAVDLKPAEAGEALAREFFARLLDKHGVEIEFILEA
jgi:hypothetical protein